MKQSILVLTALEESWPADSQPVLFLGEWCCLYSRKAQWEKFDSEVLAYHWDDRNKLYEDYKYCCELLEKILILLTEKLNEIHNVNHTLKYWRILIGPWLINFLPIVLDRWSCLNNAILTKSISEVIILKTSDQAYVPYDMQNFSTFQEDDWWNNHLYSLILQSINLKKITYKHVIKINKKKTKDSFSITSKFKSFIVKFFSILNLRNKYFIITPYIGLFSNISLNMRWFQVPLIYNFKKLSFPPVADKYRDWKLTSENSDSEFEKVLKELIPLQLPIAYLEGFKTLHNAAKDINWPKNPKIIWTSNSFYLDEVFKIWAAERVENGTPLLIGQHGGGYGQHLIQFPEYHELKICDNYITWGWGNSNPNISPIGILKKIKQKKQLSLLPQKALLVISGAPRYSGTLMSIPIAGQIIQYMNDQFEFYEKLSNQVKKDISIRLYPYDYHWDQYERWKDIFPDVDINESDSSFNKIIINSKLVISGWNSTTYLESMASNIPTIIFWRPELFEFREEAVVNFEELKRVGIYHENSSSAAIHAMKIWEDVDSWWSSQEVIEAKNNFVNTYAKTGYLVNNLHKLFDKF